MSDWYYIRSLLATCVGLTAFIAVIAGLAFYSQYFAWGFLLVAAFFLLWFYRMPARLFASAPKGAQGKGVLPPKAHEIRGQYPR